MDAGEMNVETDVTTTLMNTAAAVRLELEGGIAHLVLDDPNASANTMNAAVRHSQRQIDLLRRG